LFSQLNVELVSLGLKLLNALLSLGFKLTFQKFSLLV